MLYAGNPGSPPMGTIIRDASGRRLRSVVAFDPVTGEVIDSPSMSWLRWLHPGWKLRLRFWWWMEDRGVKMDIDINCRHWFAPAPISFEVP